MIAFGAVRHRLVFDLLGIVIAVVPIVALYKVFRRVDARRPEPRFEVLRTFALGVAVCVPTYFIEAWLRAELGSAVMVCGRVLDAFVVAAAIEETAKLTVVLAYAFHRPAFDEYTDGIVYTVAASLGFGLFENLLYVSGPASRVLCTPLWVSGLCADQGMTETTVHGLVLGLVRAFTAVPMHALAAGIMGFDIGRARLAPLDRRRSVVFIARAWAAGVLVHGGYDWTVYALGDSAVVFGVLPAILGASAFWLYVRVRKALALDLALHGPGHRDSIAGRLEPLSQ